MAYSHPEAAPLLAQLTGMPEEVAHQWLMCEAQSVNNPTNPLNIRSGASKYPNRPPQIGSKGGFGVYASQADGIGDAAWLINESSYYKNVKSTIAASPTDSLAIARAIENSPWAAGHYGHSCISSHFAGGVTPPVKPPTKPPVTPPPTDTNKGYIVRAGDTLWSIAEKYLGGGHRWQEIFNLNKHVIGSDPNTIHPGQVLVMPGGSSHPSTPPAKTKTYKVQSGDTLSALAQKFYNNASLWTVIYNANKTTIGPNPNLIHPGTVLTIPPYK